ncbi:MAG: hypothetical protein V1709_08970 [Planctomycetota bacterium]
MKRIVFTFLVLLFLIASIDGCYWRFGKGAGDTISGSSGTNNKSEAYELCISEESDKFTVIITDYNKNDTQPQTYTANSFEEFRQKYPDIVKEYELELAEEIFRPHYISLSCRD